MTSAFHAAIAENQAAFGLKLSDTTVGRLEAFHSLVMEHNPLLHLVGPGTVADFAVRHVLESLVLLDHLPPGSRFADVGPGAGLPSLPCLLVREDLRAVLIESKEKKSAFLRLAVDALGIETRVRIVNRQFQEVDPADCDTITCRALDKFTDNLPRLLKWGKRRQLLLFGGPNLRDALQESKCEFVQRLLPLSERRFLFIVDPAATARRPGTK